MNQKQTERIRTIAVLTGIFGVLYLFYRSLWALPLLIPCFIVYRKIRREDLSRQRAITLGTQFRDMLKSLAASLRVGYSTENALKECEQEMELMYGRDCVICEELRQMQNQFCIGLSAEEVFLEFARRNEVEDIDTFASVFSIAKRAGGDMVGIVERTSDNIAGRIDTRNEIAVLVSARQLEQRIMTLIPVGMILYMDLTSDGLLDPLYGNLPGILIMTVCLGIYAASILIGRKIVQIEV